MRTSLPRLTSQPSINGGQGHSRLTWLSAACQRPLSFRVSQRLKRFFGWLAHQPGYKSRIALTDIEYLNLAEKEVRAARAPAERAYPTIEQVEHAISRMPASTDIERRDRALIAFTAITGVRVRIPGTSAR